MLNRADIAVFSPDHRLQLIVEVKGRSAVTPEWATKMRRNLLAHSIIPPTPFFLLAAPEHFYLWRDGVGSVEAPPPDFVVDATPIVAPYISDTAIAADKISESGLQLILTSWLSLLVDSNLNAEAAAPHEQWLFDSGLYEAIRHGSLQTEASS
jgi:hypothetical protein